MRVKRCNGKESCKSDQEIDEFIDNNGHFSLLSNYQKYSNEDYGPKTIQNVSFAELNPITSNSRQIKSMRIEKRFLESEEVFLGDGFRVKEASFFNLKPSISYNDGSDPTSFGGYAIEMSLDHVFYSRSIYSILDLLGDVGGLYSILLDIGCALVSTLSFLFGSPFLKFISHSLLRDVAMEKRT